MIVSQPSNTALAQQVDFTYGLLVKMVSIHHLRVPLWVSRLGGEKYRTRSPEKQDGRKQEGETGSTLAERYFIGRRGYCVKQGKFSTAPLQTWLGKGRDYITSLGIWLADNGIIEPSSDFKKLCDVFITSLDEFDQIMKPSC